MSVVEDLADQLAQDALDAAATLGDDTILKKIGDALGASSATTQEAYNTAIRVRLSERRGRQVMIDALNSAPKTG